MVGDGLDLDGINTHLETITTGKNEGVGRRTIREKQDVGYVFRGGGSTEGRQV